MNSLPELIFTSIVALLLLMLPKWLPRPQECFTHKYRQFGGQPQVFKACYDGVELEIEDTGLAKLDTVWYHDHIQPKIDSLKNESRRGN